ncbi:hypothetical protein [Kribbella monticola]|uniref:hypothetical protein n=1 Tax=Kribbella monticola TaxID=2185285 RepID=UPI000DD3CA9C|nr:hypothetical protein [Kribbella monticola]
MNTLNSLAVDAMLVLMPALLVISTIWWVAARRRFAKHARSAGTVDPVGNLFDAEHDGTDATQASTPVPAPAEHTSPPARGSRRVG